MLSMVNKNAAINAEKRLQRGNTFRLPKPTDESQEVELLALTDREKKRVLEIVHRNKRRQTIHGDQSDVNADEGGVEICNLDFQGVKLLWLELNPNDNDEMADASAKQIFEKCEVPVEEVITSLELVQYFDSMKVAMDEARREHVLSLREIIWIIVGSDRKPTILLSRLSFAYTLLMQITITISVLMIFIESLPSNMSEDGEVSRTPTQFIIEATCVGIFISDILLCWISYPKGLLAYLTTFWFWLEWVLVLPFLLQVSGIIGEDNASVRSLLSLKIFRVLVRLTKVLRVAKLGKRSTEVNLVVASLYEARHPIWCLVMISSMTIVISGSILFFAEHDEAHFDFKKRLWIRDQESTYPDAGRILFFQSIPDTFWFQWVSLTTVGYGDVYPITPWGKVSGCLTMVSSVFVIGCPTTIMMSSFSQAYDKHLTRFAIKKQKERFIQRLRREQQRSVQKAKEEALKRELERETILGRCSKFLTVLDNLEENLTAATNRASAVGKRHSTCRSRKSCSSSSSSVFRRPGRESLDFVALQFQDVFPDADQPEVENPPSDILSTSKRIEKHIKTE